MHRGILFSHEKEENPAICDNLSRTWKHMLSEVSQLEKNKYCVVSIYVYKLKEPNS